MTVQRYQHERKLLPCKRCGVGIEVSIRTKKLPLHVECGVDNAIEAALQMSRKSGPYYDRWVKAMTRKYGHAPRGTPPEVTSDPPPPSF